MLPRTTASLFGAALALTQGFGPLPADVTESELKLVEGIQKLGFGAKDQYGIARPYVFPTRLCLEIVRALRGDPKPAVRTGDIRVPGT